MGELHDEPFQFAFNGFLKVAFQGSRITSDAGLLLVRELDDAWGCDIRNHTTEGDTLWVNYTTSHFSSRSTVF